MKKESWNPLKRNYYNSDKVNALSIGAEMLYIRLLAQTDDGANYDADPFLMMCGLLAKRAMKKEVNVTKVERWRDELVTGALACLYKAGDCTYIHLIDCMKGVRKDVKPVYRFPKFPEPLATTGLPAPVTDAGRARNASVTLEQPQPQPITEQNKPKTRVRARKNIGVVETSSKVGLGLEKKIKTGALRFIQGLEQRFISISKDEATTFARIAQHLSDQVRTGQKVLEIFDQALLWAEGATRAGVGNPKGLFVKKVQECTGFTGRGLLLKGKGEK